MAGCSSLPKKLHQTRGSRKIEAGERTQRRPAATCFTACRRCALHLIGSRPGGKSKKEMVSRMCFIDLRQAGQQYEQRARNSLMAERHTLAVEDLDQHPWSSSEMKFPPLFGH